MKYSPDFLQSTKKLSTTDDSLYEETNNNLKRTSLLWKKTIFRRFQDNHGYVKVPLY